MAVEEGLERVRGELGEADRKLKGVEEEMKVVRDVAGRVRGEVE